MRDWLAEFLKKPDEGIGKTLKTPDQGAASLVSAVLAVPNPPVFRKKEAPGPSNTPEQAEAARNEQAKLEAHRNFPGATYNKGLSCHLETGEIVGVLINSAILGSDVWLAFRPDFEPGDGKAVFYAHELAMLRTKMAEELRQIHRVRVRR